MKNIQTVTSKEKFYVFSHLKMRSLIYNMLFTYIMILLFFQVIDLSRGKSQKGYQNSYCYIHFVPTEILCNSVFCGFFIFFIFYFVWSFYVFDFKFNRSTMSWSMVNLHVHSYTDLQRPYNFSFAVALSANILPTVFA